ncbi:PTS sugar transporter subunit IIA [Schleiferilactobacillus harbinensis]|jgi:PTS system galactitol-specific IIA component|uniref:PTS sugar transporter subunit IIA n=1 Tax=Schleiferilactobacillus harbinensis TaxID=304207 RepID=UPI00242CEC62|nr:PTS sugar transporter subunit IIA [Schleiferilactobacillus harbinensis]MCI1688117.1 PTS sugar transporter subunit IIA [Schleiferilactobacillus harbinensis]MCI1783098.1 PTS sugar transporter subunit IIA [Schleiferilactobacillus harbinensis]MCI1851648.1 PTS sugar transporter subunit IIA [Schleiferilactobacillus harbinensis]
MGLISESLVFPEQTFANNEEALRFLAEKLNAAGKVHDDFFDAVWAREQKFPTGLPAGKINVAIPHADAKYVKESAITVATLAKPIQFHNMALTNQELPVSLIMMLAIHEPHGQVQVLQNAMALFQDEKHLAQLLAEHDAHTLFADLDKTLAGISLDQ